MLEFFIPLVGSYLNSNIFAFVILPILCLAILATIPCIIRALIRSR